MSVRLSASAEAVRERLNRRRVRLLFGVVLALCLLVLVHGYLTVPTTASADQVPEAPPTDNVTVVTESARHGTIIAWNPDGSLLYYENEHTKYYDVDPVEGESMTVEYTATKTIHSKGPTCSAPPCAKNIVERANLSTGETETIYSRYDPNELGAEWHDHERINETHILIADMIDDQILLVNTETEIIEWMWDGQSHYDVRDGGPYPGDWLHLNDVELLEDGRIVASPRNMDEVIFIEPGLGVDEDWTLGEDGNHDILYEQHNPDYIPEERGGPALIVADSENARIVEYQRENGSWERSWLWQDSQVQWPRDADRLPNGNTLIVDSNGKRVIEVDQQGDVVWEVPSPHPYDAERLGTGDESAGGQSAEALGLDSRQTRTGNGGNGFSLLSYLSALVKTIVPHWIVNGIIFIMPVWVGRAQFLALGVGIVTGLWWGVTELRWYLPPLAWRWPLAPRDEE